VSSDPRFTGLAAESSDEALDRAGRRFRLSRCCRCARENYAKLPVAGVGERLGRLAGVGGLLIEPGFALLADWFFARRICPHRLGFASRERLVLDCPSASP